MSTFSTISYKSDKSEGMVNRKPLKIELITEKVLGSDKGLKLAVWHFKELSPVTWENVRRGVDDIDSSGVFEAESGKNQRVGHKCIRFYPKGW